VRKQDTVTLNGFIKHITAKAVLFQSDFMTDEVWLPKSQIKVESEEGDEDYKLGSRVFIKVPEWLADKNGLK
jgi:hypothetical protein